LLKVTRSGSAPLGLSSCMIMSISGDGTRLGLSSSLNVTIFVSAGSGELSRVSTVSSCSSFSAIVSTGISIVGFFFLNLLRRNLLRFLFTVLPLLAMVFRANFYGLSTNSSVSASDALDKLCNSESSESENIGSGSLSIQAFSSSCSVSYPEWSKRPKSNHLYPLGGTPAPNPFFFGRSGVKSSPENFESSFLYVDRNSSFDLFSYSDILGFFPRKLISGDSSETLCLLYDMLDSGSELVWTGITVSSGRSISMTLGSVYVFSGVLVYLSSSFGEIPYYCISYVAL